MADATEQVTKLIVSTVRRPGRSSNKSHLVAGRGDGGTRTRCGLFLTDGRFAASLDDYPNCDRCQTFTSESNERKRFVRGSYPGQY